MNVKFKMPKFGRDMTVKGWLKELLMTILATTISIVLTFGTAQYLEDQQTEQARRMMAMTIINDIDESIKVVKQLMEAEEKGRNVAFYLMENIDRLKTVSEDTLVLFFNTVIPSTFGGDLEFKKANEEIFNSSQDTWRTLDDRKFLNNVQDFYNARTILEYQRKESIIFQKPVTKEELYQMMMNTDELLNTEIVVDSCRNWLKSNRVKHYIEFSTQRLVIYNDFLTKSVNQNEENKFLMNITEQDMEDFLNQTYMTVRPIDENGLVGTWVAVLPNDKNKLSYEYLKDHTFTVYYENTCIHPAMSGYISLRFTLSGTWSIEGDSLVLDFAPKSYKSVIDEHGIDNKPENARYVEEMKQLLSEKPNILLRVERNSRLVNTTNIDKSGTRLELTDDEKKTMNYQKKIN